MTSYVMLCRLGSCTLYSSASGLAKTNTGDACGSRDDPGVIDWVKKGAVTPIKNQVPPGLPHLCAVMIL